MVLRILIILFISIQSFAQDHDDCDHNKDGVIICLPDNHGDEKNFAKKYLEWWAASDLQVKNAFCRSPGEETTEEMNKYLNRKSSDIKLSKQIYGMNIENEDPHLIELLERLTKYSPPYSIDDEEDKLSQKQFNIPNDCKKVLCAAESIFGKDKATKLLYSLDKYELNLSHFTNKDLAKWETNEIDIIIESVDDLPKHLVPFQKNKALKHFKRGYGPSATTIANAVITVFSVWDNLPTKEEKMATFIHEIGHNIGSRMSEDESPRWLELSGWIEKEGVWKAEKSDQLVSKYGATNPAEDYAETFTAFRYNPELLKKASPDKYNYMKDNVFLGLEYDTEKNCQKKTTLTTLKDSIDIKSVPIPQKYSACKIEILKVFQNVDPSLKECIKKSKIRNELDIKLKDRDKVEKDTIKNAISFEEIDSSDVTDEEELKAYKILLGDIYGSIVKEYYNYQEDDCSVPEEYGSQNLSTFYKYTFNEDYAYYKERDYVNNFVKNICKENKGATTLTCDKVKKNMLQNIPKRLRSIQKIKNTEKVISSNDFRCQF